MFEFSNFVGNSPQQPTTSDSFVPQSNSYQAQERPQIFTAQPSAPQGLQTLEPMNYNYSAYLRNSASTISNPTSSLDAIGASTSIPDYSSNTVPVSPDQTQHQTFGVPILTSNVSSSSNYGTDSYLHSDPADSLNQYPQSQYVMQDVPGLVLESSSERSGSSPFDPSSEQSLRAPSNLGYPSSAVSFPFSNGHHGGEAESSGTGPRLCDDANKTTIDWNAFLDFQEELEE
jgi:hypothetical protein